MCCAGRIASQKFVCANIFPGRAHVCALCEYSSPAFLKVGTMLLLWLDSMISKVFSNLNNSVFLPDFFAVIALSLPRFWEPLSPAFLFCLVQAFLCHIDLAHPVFSHCPPSIYSGHNAVFMLNGIILSGRFGLLQRVSRQLQCIILFCKPLQHMYNHSAFLGNIGHMETNLKMLEVFSALFVFCISVFC